MIRVTEILGNIKNLQRCEKQKDIVTIQWYDVRRKIALWRTNSGREIAMRLENVPKYGISSGDILYEDEKTIVVFEILPVEVLSMIGVGEMQIAQICYEIGNRHAPLFLGDLQQGNRLELLTPYELPMQKLIEKLKVEHSKKECVLDSQKRFNVSMPHRESVSKIETSQDFSIKIIQRNDK